MDDDEGVRIIIGTLLESFGHAVEVVDEGSKATEAYARAKDTDRPFDAVILDLTVRAGMGGAPAMMELLRIDPAARGIVMSGYTEDPVVLQHQRHGFKAALAKPFNSSKLQQTLSKVMSA